MTIRLPNDPKGHDYEDQVAALLLASGHYLETRLILKEGSEEVLEFDAIATPVTDYANRKVVEVKSGSWGVADVFKLYGQLRYTNQSAAWLIHKTAISDTKRVAIAEVCTSVPVRTLHVDLTVKGTNQGCDEVPVAIDMAADTRESLFRVAWWSRFADRVAQARFRAWVKCESPRPDAVDKASSYSSALESSLFKHTALDRTKAIYLAYKAAPKLTSTLIEREAETCGKSVDEVRSEVNYSSHRAHLQYVMSLEHKARIAIIKNAYDVLLEPAGTGAASATDAGRTYALLRQLLPSSFVSGLHALSGNPHAAQAAFFFQVFVDVCGGFYFPNVPEDVELVAHVTGVPACDIPTMVGLFDAFFPIPNRWLHDTTTNLRFLKGVPAYARGAGCILRDSMRGAQWATEPGIKQTKVQWNNALYELLEPVRGVKSK